MLPVKSASHVIPNAPNAFLKANATANQLAAVERENQALHEEASLHGISGSKPHVTCRMPMDDRAKWSTMSIVA